ncbi:MAG: heme ABC exporter ATP-binding protein CcmA [Proteobacteria bacterium]|nr:heme ABC exporter ATP-binding protein CcmA [Pseudomonadota bacterium]
MTLKRLHLSPAIKALEARSLTCIRGNRLVFRDVGFRVEAGQMLSLEGPNGAGKSSLLRMVAGFLKPASGAIVLNGGEGLDDEERGRCAGWLGHHDAAKPQLSPRETLQFFAALYRIAADVDAALDEVGLGKARDLPSQYLSAGQKKRLSLARLKLSRRSLWLLDEPLAALDSAGKTLAAQIVAAHCAAGGIAIAATHEPLGLDSARLVLA